MNIYFSSRIKAYLVIALLLSSLFLCSCKKKQTNNYQEKTVRVRLQNLQKQVFQRRIPVQGTVSAIDFATVSAQTDGIIDILNVDEGDEIKASEILAVIDRRNLQNKVTVAENELAVCNSTLETANISLKFSEVVLQKAKIDYKRISDLYADKVISQSDYEDSEVNLQEAISKLDKAKAEISYTEAKKEQSQSNLAIAEKNLADSEIKAPYDCVITEKLVEQGEFVKQGTPILKLENQNKLEVSCFISAVYYELIDAGKTPVNLFFDGKDRGSAIVTYRSPNINPVSRTFKIKIELPADTKLVSGSLCEVSIILQEREGYGLPESAVMMRQNDRYVAFACNAEMRAEIFDIKRGIIDNGRCEVINYEDLLEERFIISGQTFVNPGDLLQEIVQEKE